MQRTRQIFHSRLGRPASILVTVAAIVALIVVSAFALAAPPSAYADHDVLSVVCPDAVREGNTGQMRIRRRGYEDLAVSVFTYDGSHTAQASDYTEYHGVRFESEGAESSIWVPVVTTEDTVVEHDETFSIGFWSHGEWSGCVVTIEDDDTPEITFIEISSTPTDWYAYRAGQSIDVTVNLDAKAEVDGTPLLSLFIDGTDSTWRGATYHSGSGSRALLFRYEVQPQDLDLDGITVSGAGSNADGSPAYGFIGNIFALGTDVPINYGYPSVQGGQDQIVDGRPYVQSTRVISSPLDGWQAYRTNQTIEISLTFDLDVVVEGDVTAGFSLGLDGNNWDEALRQASYLRGSGTDTLVFGYTVVPGDMDSKGVKIATGSLVGNPLSQFGGAGTIKAKWTDVEAHEVFSGTNRLRRHKVDTEAPAVSSLSITSSPANGEAYAAGETISVGVAFSEQVTSIGDLQLGLDVGGVIRQAMLRSVPEHTFGGSLVFDYTVQQGDADNDGIGIGANRLSLNGGGIHDIAGNTAGLSHDAVIADPGHKVAA